MKTWLKRCNVLMCVVALAGMSLSSLGCHDDPPPQQPQPQPVATVQPTHQPTTEEWVQIPSRVIYERGSSRLNDQGRAMLAEAHAGMAARTDIIRIRIDGHADDGGSAERNRLLAEERSLGVLDFLTGNLGMPRELFEVHSHGNTQPLTSGTTQADDAQNRRVEFRILVRRVAAY